MSLWERHWRGELAQAAHNSTQVAKNISAIRTLIENSYIVSVDVSIAEKYAKVRHELKQAGTPIPENDYWIAATCLILNKPLLTNDKHFDVVSGLETIHW